MEVPDALVLSRIEKRKLYADEKSIETSTGKTKRKYKLAGKSILDNYFFHILTTQLDSCKKKLTIIIRKEHWENKVYGPHHNPYLRGDVSYCDLTKYELLEQHAILSKIKDRENGFSYVAQLCSSKCDELHELCNGPMREYSHISDATKSIIMVGMLDNADDILLRLGLD